MGKVCLSAPFFRTVRTCPGTHPSLVLLLEKAPAASAPAAPTPAPAPAALTDEQKKQAESFKGEGNSLMYVSLLLCSSVLV